jgi:hypothetical protein
VHHLVGRVVGAGGPQPVVEALPHGPAVDHRRVGKHPAPVGLGHLREVLEVPRTPVEPRPRATLRERHEPRHGPSLRELPPEVAAHRARLCPRALGATTPPRGHAPRRPLAQHPRRMHERIPGVAAEDLVRRLAADAHLHPLRRQARHRVHGQHRRADEGLVLIVKQLAQVVGEAPAVQGDELKLQPKGLRRGLLEGPLVDDALVGEVHPEAPGPQARPRREGRHRRGVDAAGEEAPDGHVGHKLVAHDRAELVAQGLHLPRVVVGAPGEIVEFPVHPVPPRLGGDREHLAGAQHPHVLEEGALEEGGVKVQVAVEGLGVEAAREVGEVEKGLDSRSRRRCAARRRGRRAA